MAMAPLAKLVLGTFSFAIFWVLAVFPSVPLLPIGWTAGSLLGATLMVIFQVISPAQANASIDLSILGLLFGTMVVSVYLERADAFMYLGKLLSWKSQGAKDLICRVCLLSAISSAFFTNDTSSSAACISPDYVKKSWLILAWVSTVAGNLSLLGSAANMIVCEQARRDPDLGYNLSFWSHLKFGVPSTIAVTAIGLIIIG
ncbi:unnamed protein product [Dovyalis caffra]|uniref:Citrate transporter-like domain-containing protein n=1 Tax=Dovyalis caffra TaxID=77055 RepID=A0AAV1RKZ5_9ROSI|nr:unnamed protein product [Dovyalis caffra]